MNSKVTTAVVVSEYEGPGDYPAKYAKGVSLISNLGLGTGTGKANRIFADDRSIAASSNEDLDLAGGIETPFGETLTLTKIKAILILADEDNGGNIEVGPASSNGFTGPFKDASDRLVIPAGGAVLLQYPGTGWTVTAGTGDLLNVANTDGDAAGLYTICIVGEGTVA